MDSSVESNLRELIARVWKIYKALSSAPEELRDVQNGALSVVGGWRLLYEHFQEYQLSSDDTRSLKDHITRSSTVISELDKALKGFKQQPTTLQDVAKIGPKLVIQAARVSSFYEILQRNSYAAIILPLGNLRQSNPERFNLLLSGEWLSVAADLQELGIPEDFIEEEYFFISNWLNGHRQEQVMVDGQEAGGSYVSVGASSSISLTSTDQASGAIVNSSSEAAAASTPASRMPLPSTEPLEDEELPGYSPGKKPTTLAEKTRNLDQTSAILNSEVQVTNLGKSSTAPPAYTFEDGNDQEMDEIFSQYIQQAIAAELRRRYQEREVFPKRGPFPHMWLPKKLQDQFAERQEVMTMMTADSFSVMAYQSAPHYLLESEGLIPLLRMSSDGTGDDSIFAEGTRTLKTMGVALFRFVNVQDPRPGDDQFSDLDALDYEYDTARALDDRMQSGVDHRFQFPTKAFELAQKSYYNMLTYVMGMLKLMEDIFPGRTFVTRSRGELRQLWSDRRMSARTAWIEKQLAVWDHVDEAVTMCRDWHRLRPVREQALSALELWRQSVPLLTSAESPDQIQLTIISVENLPKARNTQIKIHLYATHKQRPGWTWRAYAKETSVAKMSKDPIYNHQFGITCPEMPIMMDIEVHELGIIPREIGRVRMKFVRIPGVEFSLDGRSLMYGVDEQLALAIPIPESRKGKEKEGVVPTLNIHLQWKGRYPMVEEAGLPTQPPGKMFRKPHSPVPVPFDNGPETTIVASINRALETGGSFQRVSPSQLQGINGDST